MTKPAAEPATPFATGYAFDNSHRQTTQRFPALSDMFDAGTVGALSEVGVDRGWRCLEVGAGGGSIAEWLCERVGPHGHVVATDIDTRFLDDLRHPNLTVRKHDIVDGPVDPGSFDLVHARLLLVIVPDRERALANMIADVKPGGFVVCEEFDSLSMIPDAAINPAETDLKTLRVMREVMARRNADIRYGRLVAGRLRQIGCVDVRAYGRVAMWHGGSAGARLLRANFLQLKADMILAGLTTDREVEADIARLDDPDIMFPSPVMWTVRGQCPK